MHTCALLYPSWSTVTYDNIIPSLVCFLPVFLVFLHIQHRICHYPTFSPVEYPEIEMVHSIIKYYQITVCTIYFTKSPTECIIFSTLLIQVFSCSMSDKYPCTVNRAVGKWFLTLLSRVPLAASCSSCSSILNVLIFRDLGGVLAGICSREPKNIVLV